jgi:hypothetical protein
VRDEFFSMCTLVLLSIVARTVIGKLGSAFGMREGSFGELRENVKGGCGEADVFGAELREGSAVCKTKALDFARSELSQNFGMQLLQPRCAWGDMRASNHTAASYYPDTQFLRNEHALGPERRALLAHLVDASRCSQMAPNTIGLELGHIKTWAYETTFGEWMRDTIGEWARQFRVTTPASGIGSGHKCIRDYHAVSVNRLHGLG